MNKNDMKKSLIITFAVTFLVMAYWFGFSKLLLGYDPAIFTKQILKKDSAVQETLIGLVGTDTTWRLVVGTTPVTFVGTSTDATLPRIEFDGLAGLWKIKGLQGTQTERIGTITADYLTTFGSDYVLRVGGSSTNQLATNATIAGSTTIDTESTITVGTQTFDAEKVQYLADVDEAIEAHFTTVENKVSTHAHTGSDGSTQISHNNVLGTGTKSHAELETFNASHAHGGTDSVKIDHNNQLNVGTNNHEAIDLFISSKAQVNGIASLNGSSLVVQNPANVSVTPGANKIVQADGSGIISDNWLSTTITKLGSSIAIGVETTGNTDNLSEGSTNKYYTDARVITVLNNNSLNQLADVILQSVVDGHYLVYSTAAGAWINGTSSVAVNWGAIIGVPTDNSYVTATPGTNKIPYNTGNLDGWLSAQVVGSTTGAVNYNVRGNGSGKIDNSWFASGTPVKVSFATTNSSSVGLGTIPHDDTIPQNTEGSEILTVTHTPNSSSNYIIVEGCAQLYVNNPNPVLTAAIFKNSDVNAIGAQVVLGGQDPSNLNRLSVVYPVVAPFVAGTTSAITFKMRAGSNAGDCGYNRASVGSARALGGSMYTMLKVTEYKP